MCLLNPLTKEEQITQAMNHVEVLIDEEKVYCLCRGSCTNKRINACDNKLCETRLMVVSREAKEEVANSAPMDSRLTHVSILQEQEL